MNLTTVVKSIVACALAAAIFRSPGFAVAGGTDDPAHGAKKMKHDDMKGTIAIGG